MPTHSSKTTPQADADLLQSLGVDPAQLDPAPLWTPCGSASIERLQGRHPCLRCGQPSTVAGVVEVLGFGRRWIDRCMPCLVASTPRGGPRVPLESTVAVIREAAREAGATVTIVTDGA
ncbi:hypothetical protein OG345_05305 [Streptomyces sp. NBC_01220]|uniref:hypothetical protein n=1 Tax=Streptomyces sp. NBC_01220 TaxID=2903781 RepID=UPI00352C42E4|nr:hypothetical protein OG345_05305 [Streptomyces sp. NBC_01220]